MNTLVVLKATSSFIKPRHLRAEFLTRQEVQGFSKKTEIFYNPTRKRLYVYFRGESLKIKPAIKVYIEKQKGRLTVFSFLREQLHGIESQLQRLKTNSNIRTLTIENLQETVDFRSFS